MCQLGTKPQKYSPIREPLEQAPPTPQLPFGKPHFVRLTGEKHLSLENTAVTDKAEFRPRQTPLKYPSGRPKAVQSSFAKGGRGAIVVSRKSAMKSLVEHLCALFSASWNSNSESALEPGVHSPGKNGRLSSTGLCAQTMVFLAILSVGMAINSRAVFAQAITPTTTTSTLQSVLAGVTSGATISNVTITSNVSGKGNGVGTFSNAGGFAGSGVVLRTGTLNSTNPNTGGGGSNPNFDITTIEFDVVPTYNSFGVKYSFFSWEYPEYVGSAFNDNVDIIVTGAGLAAGGVNLASLPNSTTPVQINTINGGTVGLFGSASNAILTNSAFFTKAGCSLIACSAASQYDSTAAGSQYTLDGGTIPLQNVTTVQAGQTYHIKITINDIGDAAKDSQAYVGLLFSGPPNTTMSKAVSPTGPVAPSTQLTYTLPLTNQGFSSDKVDVSDSIPANATYVAASASNSGTLSGSTVTWSNLIVPAGTCANTACSTITPGTLALTFKVLAGSSSTAIQNSASFATTLPYTPSSTTSNTVTTAVSLPDLTLTKTHTGNFTQGQTGATYTLTATNSGTLATSGTVTVVDTLPTGLTATAISGTGWTCTLGTLTCTRSDALAAGSSYPAITLTVNVAANAASSITNDATVSGGGETNTANDTVTDPTTVTVVSLVSISGRVFEDMNYGGGAGRDFTTSGSNGRQNARVELYSSAGAFLSTTTTDASGNYSFSVNLSTAYTVRVVNISVTSSRPGYVNTLVPVQTFRTNGLTANIGTADPNRVGGETPQLMDAGNGSTTLAALTTATTTAQSITPVAIGIVDATGIDFGYNFDTIVNTKDSGQGSLRQFITNSNALTNPGLAQQGLTVGQETSIFMIPDGSAHAGLRAGLTNQVAGTGGNANAAVINLASNLSITDANTQLDATTQTINIGDSNSGTVGTGGIVGADGLSLSTIPKPEVVLNFQAVPNNTNAILVSGANTVLKGFASYGYRSNNNLGTLLNAAIVIQSGVTNAGPATVTQLLGGTLADGSNPGVPTLTIGHTFQTAGAANISNNYLAYNADAISFENTNGTNVNFINNELAYNGPKDNNSSNVSGIYSDQMETVSGTRNITIRGNLVRNSSKPGFANAQGQGLQLTYSTFITVENNTFTDNNVYGIYAASSDTLIQKNIITGTKNTGLGQGIGVAVYYGNGTGLRNRISQNSIYQNAKLGIDHLVSGTTPGVNPNDGTVNAALANNGMDYPIITSSTLSGGTLTVQGYVGNAAGGSATFANATLEFFLAADDGNNNGKVFSSDPGSVSQPHGEGKTYLGTLTTDGSGNFSGNLTVPAGVTLQLGDLLTATATDSVGNTSEFSANASVTVPVASNPELILVKRITAINTSPITTVIDPTTTPDPNDEAPNWPVAYLKGSVDTGIVKPGDELEYTIYFLSSGDAPITKVNICDLVPANSTFIPTTYNGLSPADGGLPGADSGISLTIGSSPFYLSNAKDTDRGEFFLADTTPSGTCSGANDNGAVVVNIVTGANTLPNATAPGTPTNSYGFIRFRALVK
jgi:trimeric autotransporter adhesin